MDNSLDTTRAIANWMRKLRKTLHGPSDPAAELALFEEKAAIFDRMAEAPNSILWGAAQRAEARTIAATARAHAAALRDALAKGGDR